MRISDWSSDVCSSDLVRRVAKRSQLRAERDAAAQHGELEVGDAGGQLAQLLADLVGQFAGGAQHQRLGADGLGVDRLQHTQAECGGLAAAGGCLRDYVAAFKEDRKSTRLNSSH